MKILFITSYPLEYNSSSNVRNLGLIEGFLANGDDVYTYSPYPKDLNLFSGKLLALPFSKRYWIGGVPNNETESKSLKNNCFKSRIKGIMFKIYNFFSLYDRRSLLLNRVSSIVFDTPFDVMISSSDPKSAHLFAEKLRNENPCVAKRWIQYWGDPFTGDISYKRFLGSIRTKKEERRLIALADKVVYVSPFTAEEMKSKYANESSKIEFYPIPYRLSNTPKELYSIKEKELVIGYMGDYNSNTRNILPLYNAMKRSGIKSYIIGNSDFKLDPFDNIIIRNRLLGEEFKKMTQSVNVIVCVCNLSGTQIPGKIYHYVNTGKPILIIVDGDSSEQMKEYFNSFGRFYICDNKESSILEMITCISKERKTFVIPEKLNPQEIANQVIQ